MCSRISIINVCNILYAFSISIYSIAYAFRNFYNLLLM